MSKLQSAIDSIRHQAILPLFYADNTDTCINTCKALYNAGIRNIEFTNRGPKALENFTLLVKERDAAMPGLLLGIGTIKTGADAILFLEAKADFLVSPVFDAEVCDVAYMNKTLWIPGCMTPTEIHAAQGAGCSMIKLFPGSLLQPAFIAAIKPLFKNIYYIVTGGVETSEQNMNTWYTAGADVLGLGSSLISNPLLSTGQFDRLTQITKNVLATVQKLKGSA